VSTGQGGPSSVRDSILLIILSIVTTSILLRAFVKTDDFCIIFTLSVSDRYCFRQYVKVENFDATSGQGARLLLGVKRASSRVAPEKPTPQAFQMGSSISKAGDVQIHY
jgi:hypothetical protein